MIRKRVDVTIKKDALSYKVGENVKLHCRRQNAQNLIVQSVYVEGWDAYIEKV